MFRKYYREAVNDIKPDPGLVESVIAASKKRRPPLRFRYAKYAAIAAAAVVVVSGAALSMPLWQKVEDNTDGVIIEETVTDNASSESKPDAAPESVIPTAAPAQTALPQNTKSVNSSESKPKPTQIPSQTTSEHSYIGFGESQPRQVTESEKTETVSESDQTQTAADSGAAEAENSVVDEASMIKKAVLGETDAETRENKMPSDMAPYSEAADVSAASSAMQAEIADTDIPTPAGYRCTSATPRGYTFVNDDGAVITVTINYGGEEREPYIEEDGDNIYAVFTSFGLSVTINASGADRERVEEIINSLR